MWRCIRLQSLAIRPGGISRCRPRTWRTDSIPASQSRAKSTSRIFEAKDADHQQKVRRLLKELSDRNDIHETDTHEGQRKISAININYVASRAKAAGNFIRIQPSGEEGKKEEEKSTFGTKEADHQQKVQGLLEKLSPPYEIHETDTHEEQRKKSAIHFKYVAARAKAAESIQPLGEEEKKEEEVAEEPTKDERTVVVISAASKYLVFDDFARLHSRTVKHENWDKHANRLLHVIPGRDMDTLERQEHYFLVFSSAKAARSYELLLQDIFKRVHWPMDKPIPPHLGFWGEDFGRLLQDYTLASPEESLYIKRVQGPFPPSVQGLLDCGGYPALITEAAKSPAAVIIRTVRANVTTGGLAAVFKRAERERKLPFTGDEIGSLRLVQWLPPVQPDSFEQLRNLAEQQDSSPRPEWRPEVAEHDDEGDQPTHRIAPQASGLVFLVGLQTKLEADVFARHWHRRKVSLPFQRKDRESSFELTAEVL